MQKIVAYGSLTGNTQMAAMMLASELGCDSYSFEELTQEIVNKADLIIVGVSTWGEGEYNPQTEDFVIAMEQKKVDMSGKKVGLFGLGDSTYQIFCGAVDKLAQVLKDNGAEIVGTIHKIDGFIDEEKQAELNEWTKGILNLLSSFENFFAQKHVRK